MSLLSFQFERISAAAGELMLSPLGGEKSSS